MSRVTLAVVVLLALLAGCSAPGGLEQPDPGAVVVAGTAPPLPSLGDAAARHARTLLGIPYRYGGADPGGFDCSGLVHYVYGELGVSLPRTTEAQQQAVQAVPLDALQPGDLIFFRLPSPHVGLYAGAGEFVHAPGSGRTVETATLAEPWFLLAFAGAGRVVH